MIEVAGRYGYGGASVARVVRTAGVSRATFYESFDDRENCFRAAAQQLAAAIGRRVGELEEGTPVQALAQALDAAEQNPAATRVVLLELLAAPLTVRKEYERLLDSLASAIGAAGDGWFAGGSRLALPPRALLGGLGGVVASRAFRGEAGHLREMTGDLLAWAGSYALEDAPTGRHFDWREAGARLCSDLPAPQPLGGALDEDPPRRGSAAASLVAERQRRRLFAAMARLCRERGYAEVRVQDLVASAAITRESFYKHFRSKEDAFLATQAYGLEQSVAFSARRFFSEESWLDRVWSGLEATLTYIASQPDLVYVDLSESYAAGPAAIQRSFENRIAFTLFLEQGFQLDGAAATPPRICAEAIAGAIHELWRREVVAGRSEQMLSLLPLTVYLALAPFLGAAKAIEFVEGKFEDAPSGA